MGTHSLIIMRVQRTNGPYDTHCVLWQEYDGYIEHGVGEKLIKFLENTQFLKHYDHYNKGDNVLDEPEYLFTQLIYYFEKETGNCKMYNPNSFELEDYNYYVDYTCEGDLMLTIKKWDKSIIYSGKSIYSEIEKVIHSE